MAAATCATVVACSNCRCEPSGSVMEIMMNLVFVKTKKRGQAALFE
jgi:hypothetical protein